MKKRIALLAASLVIILLFAGCATTETEIETDTVSEVSVPEVRPASGAPAEGPKEALTPKKAKKLGIDALFDETDNWPDNTMNSSVPMNPAEDAEFWDNFIILANNGASTEDMENFLITWYGVFGWTPEFYAACHNYFIAKAASLLDVAANENDIEAVYACFDRCFAATFHGGMQYPDRLDLWCGYVHAANMLGCYEDAAACCQAIISRLDYNSGNWYWTYNEPFYGEDGASVQEKEFVGIMHDYICEWLNVDTGLAYAIPVGERLIEYYPENAVALNDLAICYIYNGQSDKARVCLENAYAANPDDCVVIGNLAYLCEDEGEYETALSYAYQLLMSGDAEYVDMAINLISEINKLMYPDK